MTRLTDRQKWAFAWIPRSDVLVDIGSSATPLLERLNEKSVQAIAVDIDRLSLLQAQVGARGLAVLEASSERLPIASGSADTALLLDVLEHVTDERKTIAEVWRILKPGGIFILSVPQKGLFRFLDPQNLRAKMDGKFSAVTEHRHYAEQDLLRLLGGKFSVLRTHYGGLFLYPVTFAANNFFSE